jgi:2-C-methyl-D-erythritol 4-phosphate cytidylyltransferase
MKKFVIIVAGGSGKRLGTDIPKQFLLLNEQPLLMHTIKRFYEADAVINVIVVIPEKDINYWKTLTAKYNFNVEHKIVKGGNTRFQSVSNGLEIINEQGIVAIHDGVRPFCSAALINRCFQEAEKNSNAIPVVKIPETIRQVSDENNFIVERDMYRLVQTPQCFNLVKLKKAYGTLKSGNEKFTDDAGVFENDGNKIHLIEGEKNNIKITVKEDLVIANAIEKNFFSATF